MRMSLWVNLFSSLVLALSVSLSAAAGPLEEAQQHLQQKRFAEALQSFDGLLKQQAASLSGLLGRAQAHLALAEANQDDIFTRAEHLEAALRDLDQLLKLQALHPEGLLRRAQTLVQQAEVTLELGAGAFDYWTFVNEKVAPLQERAWADANRLIALKTPLTAEAYYWRAHAHEEVDTADLQQACALKYAPACQKP